LGCAEAAAAFSSSAVADTAAAANFAFRDIIIFKTSPRRNPGSERLISVLANSG
jgi:hypothetical protein